MNDTYDAPTEIAWIDVVQVPMASRAWATVTDWCIVGDVQLGDVGADSPVHGACVLARLPIAVVHGDASPTLQKLWVSLTWLPTERLVRFEVFVRGLWSPDAAKEDPGQFRLHTMNAIGEMELLVPSRPIG
jgi:hypothetical protein